MVFTGFLSMTKYNPDKISVEKWGAGDELFNRLYMKDSHTREEWEQIYYTYLALNAEAPDSSCKRRKEQRRRRRR